MTSWRTLRQKRNEDIAFIERLRVATSEDIEQLYTDHVQAPEWKREAIRRVIRRLTAVNDKTKVDFVR